MQFFKFNLPPHMLSYTNAIIYQKLPLLSKQLAVNLRHSEMARDTNLIYYSKFIITNPLLLRDA